ncbi:MAG: alanine racemase [bacterium]|nr:alanine racemase [bacterium]
MSTKRSLANLRTWIEIDSRAVKKNYATFRKLISPKTKLWAVVKSNAYGHGLIVFSKLAQKLGVDGFCVDSLVEGLRLRKEGIKKPILVLGPTLPALFREAEKNKITISISNFEALKSLARSKAKPQFHLKIDTGMHRQGFYLNDLSQVIKIISKSEFLISKLKGIYTHFASAKDINYPTYTEKQFSEFQKATKLFSARGGSAFGGERLMYHCAATGATLINPKYHLDAVRVGIGLYGLWPSKELEMQLRRSAARGGRSSDPRASELPRVELHPVLSWRAVVSEVKNLNQGDYVGYDLAERVHKKTKMAILPIGYWHGFPRALSGAGEVLVRGHRANVLGRVSMDLVIIDARNTRCVSGEVATLIGRDNNDEILAYDVAQKAGTIHYELLTRLNPLIERILV